MVARADLHVHSRHSDRPSEWLLRRIGAPESFTEPLELYRRARAAGMDFVTISDHDTIAGALEIAHLPGTFVSCEVTASFPEDGSEVHVLVWGIDEAEHSSIQEARDDLYGLVRLLRERRIVHALAHPLFRQSDRLTVAHFERLLLLFKRFEAINGTRLPRGGELTCGVLAGLTPELMAHLAERHGLDPEDPEPWVKHTVGGSDDHAGLYLGRTWTETPAAASSEEFLAHLAAGRSRPGGEHGSSLRLARCFTSIACRYYSERVADKGEGWDEPLGAFLERLLARGDLADLPAVDRLRLLVARRLRPRRRMEVIDRALLDELVELATPAPEGSTDALEERCFRIAGRLSDNLAYGGLRKFGKHLARGKLTESVQSLSALAPAAIAVAPYLAAFQTQHHDAPFHREVEARFAVPRRPASAVELWFAERLGPEVPAADLDSRLTALARGRGRRLATLACSGDLEPPAEDGRPSFSALGSLELPDLPGIQLAFPPLLAMLAECERHAPSAIVVNAPGPVGLVGLLAARLLSVPLIGVYEAGLVERLAPPDGPGLAALVARYVRWFYGQARLVYAASTAASVELVALGLRGPEVRPLPQARVVGGFRQRPAAAGRYAAMS